MTSISKMLSCRYAKHFGLSMSSFITYHYHAESQEAAAPSRHRGLKKVGGSDCMVSVLPSYIYTSDQLHSQLCNLVPLQRVSRAGASTRDPRR